MPNAEDGLQRILNSPESLSKIAELAKSLRGESEMAATDAEPTAADSDRAETGADLSQVFAGLELNPTVLRVLSGAVRGYTENDKRTRLLEALRPFAHDANAGMIERAINAVRIARTAKNVLKSLGGGDRLV